MKAIIAKTLKLALPALMAAGIAFSSPGEAEAQVAVSVGYYPPAAYIATATPEYYEGRPVYYYNNNWYYRDRYNHWGYYRSEPGYLRERRSHWAEHRYPTRVVRGPARYHYRR
jgi:hypothetical protein